MAYKYEPESSEKSEAYCKCIESRSKLERTRRLDSLNEEEFDRLLQSMQKCERWEDVPPFLSTLLIFFQNAFSWF